MTHSLNFNEAGRFRILQLTDLHYTEGDAADQQTVALMDRLLRQEQPDLVVITGDLVYGEHNAEFLPQVLAPLTQPGAAPWTFVLGNHDSEFGLRDREALWQIAGHLPGCVAWADPDCPEGTGNHSLALRSADGTLCWLLLLLDSGAYNPNAAVGGYAYVTPAQTDWYRRQIKLAAAENPAVEALLFQHIPLPEYEDMWRFETCYGSRRDPICCPRVNSGLFNAILESGHTRAVFVGHDHVNDFWGVLYGIMLGYGRATGYHTYGAQDFMHGGRIFELDLRKPGEITTYVRLENGTKVDQPWRFEPRERRA
ncbi:MAG: metallophosphoesterase family protein [Oscillospiraceae bacterium]|nr:metallophosphoesterase family protein [Oscillospiraceae bacterium]MDD4368832.1 metallophosphoesterase family protein [Oscillospiraceae bacterium]